MKNKSKIITALLIGMIVTMGAGSRLMAKPFPPKGEYLEDFRYLVLQDDRCWNFEYGFINCDINKALLKIKNNCEVYTSKSECDNNCPKMTIAGELTSIKQVWQLKLICERL